MREKEETVVDSNERVDDEERENRDPPSDCMVIPLPTSVVDSGAKIA